MQHVAHIDLLANTVAICMAVAKYFALVLQAAEWGFI